MVWPEGKAAFVTGAASGMGLGISRALVAAGAKVALVDVDGARLAGAAKELTDAGGTVTAIEFDISDAGRWPEVADRAEEALGPISILVNNAGVSGLGPLDEVTFDVWRWVQSININGQFLGVRTFLPRFKARGGRAHILNTASMAGLVPNMDAGAYVASKFASVGFSLVLRDELKGTEVGVSMLCPGSVATRISETGEESLAKLQGREPNTAAIESNSALLAEGANPDRVGEQVLEAMQNKQFVIITHREWLPLVQDVHREIERAFTEFDGRHGPDKIPQMLANIGHIITTTSPE